MKCLMINSAKGGVGKTTITENVAITLRNLKQKVLVLDLDTSTPNVSKIPGVTTVTSDHPTLRMSKSSLKTFIRTALREYNRKTIDWLIIDTPPTISDTYFAISEVIKNAKILYVSTGDSNSIKDTGVGIRFFSSRGFNTLGIIQNMICDEIGGEFDSIKELGIKTLETIPFSDKDDVGDYFDWVRDLLTMDFNEVGENVDLIRELYMSKMTIPELERMPTSALRFYNLETWDYVRDRVLNDERYVDWMMGVSHDSRFDVSKEDISDIMDVGVNAMVLVMLDVGVVGSPIQYSVIPVEVSYTNDVSRGLPMFLMSNGTYLWMSEAKLAKKEYIKDILEYGGYELGDGTILPSLYEAIQLRRTFTRGLQFNKENEIIKHYQEVLSDPPDNDYIRQMYASLEGYDSFYDIFNDKDQYDLEYITYLQKYVALGE